MTERPDARALFSGKIRPVANVFDISVREAGTTSVYGQTARSMMRAYQLAREVGFTRTQIASLSFGDRYTVQDQFIELLKEKGDELYGCFVSFPIEKSTQAISKIASYGIKNVFIDFFVGDDHGRVDRTRANMLGDKLITVLGRLRSILPPPSLASGGRPAGEIFINFGDFFEQRMLWEEFFTPIFRNTLPYFVQGVCFEEFRGAALPEEMFDAAAFLRAHFGFSTHQVLAHVHGGNGLEDACNLAAVHGGADGIWASMTPTSALAGHGSSLVYLTNLYRYGNLSVARQYNLRRAHDIVTELYSESFAGNELLPIEMPVFGRNAYSVNFRAFSQDADLPGMLPAQVVGRSETSRFVPLLCDATSIRRRYQELGCGKVSDSVVTDLLDSVHRYLLDDLSAPVDTRIDFNAPEFLLRFVQPSVADRVHSGACTAGGGS